MTPADYIVSCLATRMYSEPKDDGLLGFTAAGLVIRNRVMAGWGPWLTLITNHDTYSAKPDAPRTLVFGDPDHDTIFRRCIGIAENIFGGREKDITEGALWYGRLDDCSEDFKEKIVRPPRIIDDPDYPQRDQAREIQAHPMVAKIGRQMFFK